MKYVNQKQLHMVTWVLSLLLLGILLLLCIGVDSDKDSAFVKPEQVDTVWVHSDNNKGDTIFHAPGKINIDVGEPLTLTTKLSDSLMHNTVLLVKSEFQHFVVRVDEQVLYTLDFNENHSIGHEPFPGYHMIAIPVGYGGQQLTLEITSTYEKYSGMVNRLLLGNRGDVLMTLAYEQFGGLLGGILLVLIGGILFFAKVMLGAEGRKQYALSYTVLLLVLSGVFLLSGNSFLMLMTTKTQVLWMLRLFVILILPLIYTLYLRAVVEKRRVLRFVEVGIILGFLNVLIAVVLIAMGMVDVTVYVTIGSIFFLAILGLMTFILIIGGIHFEQGDLTYFGFSNIVFIVAFVLQYVFYNVNKLMPFAEATVAVGVLIWCAMMLLYMEGILMDFWRGERLLQQIKLSELREDILMNLKPDTIFGGFHTLLDYMKRQDSDAPQFLVHISNYVRGRFNMLFYEEDKMIPFEEELKHIVGCLELRMQKEGTFSYTLECKEMDFYVPAFSIEAFVENAVSHGAGTISKPGEITVKTYETKDDYGIQIVDTGKGFHTSDVKSKGKCGILAVTRKLHVACEGTVDIKSKLNQGTIVTIKLPKSSGKVRGEETW